MNLVNIFKTLDSQNQPLLQNLRPHFDIFLFFLALFFVSTTRPSEFQKHLKSGLKHCKRIFLIKKVCSNYMKIVNHINILVLIRYFCSEVLKVSLFLRLLDSQFKYASWKKMPLDGVVDFLSKSEGTLQQSVLCLL